MGINSLSFEHASHLAVLAVGHMFEEVGHMRPVGLDGICTLRGNANLVICARFEFSGLVSYLGEQPESLVLGGRSALNELGELNDLVCEDRHGR